MDPQGINEAGREGNVHTWRYGYWKTWKLPSKNKGLVVSNDSGDNEVAEILNSLEEAYNIWKNTKNDLTLHNLKALILKLEHRRSDLYLEVLETFHKVLMREDTWLDNRHDPETWDATKAGTMVSHVITYGAANRQCWGAPLQYILEDPNTSYSVNLVHIFRQAQQQEEIKKAMLLIWKHIKLFMLNDMGIYAAEIVKKPRGDDAAIFLNTTKQDNSWVTQMKIFKDLLKRTKNEPTLSGKYLELLYANSDIRSLTFDLMNKEDNINGKLTMQVSLGIPDVSDFNKFLCPKEVKKLINFAFHGDKHSMVGAFVSISCETDKLSQQHHLFLSEYSHTKEHATFCQGYYFKSKPNIINNDAFQRFEFSIDNTRVEDTNPSPKYRGQTLRMLRAPLTDILLMIDHINANHYDLTPGQVLQFIQTVKEHAEETELGPSIVNMFTIDAFSGSNIGVLLIYWNTSYDFIREWLGLRQPTGPEGQEIYVQVLAVRYPTVYRDLEKLMYRLRMTRFYNLYGREDPRKWKQFSKGKFVIDPDTTEPRPWSDYYENDPNEFPELPQRLVYKDDPSNFPELPQTVQAEDLENLSRRDTRGRLVFPFRPVTVLPEHAKYRQMGRNSDIGPFYLNYMKDNENNPANKLVFYIKPRREEDWNHLQLLRINNEIKVSILGYLNHKESFYDFRRLTEFQEGEHPFGSYLDKYSDLKDEWRRLWNEDTNDLSDWTQREIEADGESQRRGRRGRRDRRDRRDRRGRRGQGEPQQDEAGEEEPQQDEAREEEPQQDEAGENQAVQTDARASEAPRQASRITRAARLWLKNAALRRRNEKALIQLLYKSN